MENGASAKDLSKWDSSKHEILYRGQTLNPEIVYVTNFPKLEELVDMAETENTDKLTSVFWKVQTEYNQLSTEFAKFVVNDLIDYKRLQGHLHNLKYFNAAIPTKTKYLNEKTAELKEAKKSLNILMKSRKKDSPEIKHAEKDIKKLETTIRLITSEIKELEEDIPKMKKSAVLMVHKHYMNMTKAQLIWDSMVTVLFNFVWLEDQWITVCNTVNKPEMYKKAFRTPSIIVNENTKLFISLTKGWFACTTIGILKTNYGSLADQPKYTEEDERKSLTCFDDENT